MPGYTREMQALVNARIDMNNKYQLLMKEVHDRLLLFRPDVYIVAHPDPPETPAVIKSTNHMEQSDSPTIYVF